MERGLESRQGDVDDGAVHEGQGGAQDDGDQNPLAVGLRAGCCSRGGAHLGTWRDDVRLGNGEGGHWVTICKTLSSLLMYFEYYLPWIGDVGRSGVRW